MIVEDDEKIRGFIAAVLTSNEYRIVIAETGAEAVTMASSHCPDLILLDLGLPDMDGIEVLKTIRKWTGLPIIIVSARGHENEKVEALDLGADDYITKPFGSSELLARIRTGLRHTQAVAGGAQDGDARLKLGDLEIDYTRRIVTVDGAEIHLTPIEYKIIVLLSRHLGKVLTYDAVMREVWGPYASERQALRVNMANIRRKLEANPGEPKHIVTEVGVGYRMLEDSRKE